jgi:hypothetical protein
VTVKAFNRTQFEIIDILYMRLGFSIFLEWGNSMYFENNGTYINNLYFIVGKIKFIFFNPT